MRLRGSTQDTETKEDLQMDEMAIHEVVLDQASSWTSSEQYNLETQCATAKKEVQCDIPTLGKFSIKGMKHNSKMIAYYTGFNGYDHFMLIFKGA